MAVETYLQGAEISASQFFEIWHHYDSDGDSLSFFPVPAWNPSRGGGDLRAGLDLGKAEKAARSAFASLFLFCKQETLSRRPPEVFCLSSGTTETFAVLAAGVGYYGPYWVRAALGVACFAKGHPCSGYLDGKELQKLIQDLQQARKKAGL
ncbi:UNVERIFIED_CONTAM: hypothetical protein K2H54_035668 [Gekko kuhli]